MGEQVIMYRDITILVKQDGRFYTLGQHYRQLAEAESKIDRYLDTDEGSDSVWD